MTIGAVPPARVRTKLCGDATLFRRRLFAVVTREERLRRIEKRRRLFKGPWRVYEEPAP